MTKLIFNVVKDRLSVLLTGLVHGCGSGERDVVVATFGHYVLLSAGAHGRYLSFGSDLRGGDRCASRTGCLSDMDHGGDVLSPTCGPCATCARVVSVWLSRMCVRCLDLLLLIGCDLGWCICEGCYVTPMLLLLRRFLNDFLSFGWGDRRPPLRGLREADVPWEHPSSLRCVLRGPFDGRLVQDLLPDGALR